MKDRLDDLILIDKMFDIMNTDKKSIWNIYIKEVNAIDIILTFCKYEKGIERLQSQAITTIDDWNYNKSNFEKLAYIREI